MIFLACQTQNNIQICKSIHTFQYFLSKINGNSSNVYVVHISEIHEGIWKLSKQYRDLLRYLDQLPAGEAPTLEEALTNPRIMEWFMLPYEFKGEFPWKRS